jgi:glycosyltransferase involved in cell wall biosynthesis
MAQRLGVPVMLTALGSDVNVYADYPARRRQMLGAFRRADHVTAVSTALVDRIRDMGTDGRKISCIGNGVDTSLFRRADDARVREWRDRLGLRPERKYLLFVGRLHPVKGLSCLLEALVLLHSRGRLDFDTILVGDGELRRECEDFVSRRGIRNNVRFAGEVPHGRVHEWLQACDMLCLPSLMEGMPNVVLEAQACGLPVVASRVGALPGMIGPGAGILVEPRDPVKLAEALERAWRVTWDREEIARAAGLQGWETVAAHYFEAIRAIANPAGVTGRKNN